MFAVGFDWVRTCQSGDELQEGEVMMATVPPEVEVRIRASQARSIRDATLRSCDWTQMPDARLTPEAKQAWAVYRQRLRDLPAQNDFPDCPWPDAPTLQDGAASEERAAL